MDRWHFLDAQLWMRKAAVSAWTSTDAMNAKDRAQTPPSKALLLLPPQSPTNAAPDAATTTAWCCFHVGSRYCFFRAGDVGEDQTQFQLELMLQKGSKEFQLLARFDGKYVYAVDLCQVVDIILPKPAATNDLGGAQPVTQQQQQEAPPFGCLEFQNVSLRVWMDPQYETYPSARQILQSALVCVQQCALKVRNGQCERPPGSHNCGTHGSWRDAFRHSEWLVDRKATAVGSALNSVPAALQTTSSEFLKRARRILIKDADFEAVKMTCSKIVRASSQSSPNRRRRRKRIDGEDAPINGGKGGSDDDDADENGSQREKKFYEMNLILLLTELAHIFGEEHDGVNELLGFSASGAACIAHERCYDLHQERAEVESSSSSLKTKASCVTSKWQAWDEYLEVSAQVASQDNNRHFGDEAKSVDVKNAKIHAAAAAFQDAIVSEEDTSAELRRTKMQRDQILSYERMGFSAFFPDRSKRRKHERPVATTDARRLQQQMKAEQMFAVLLEKRKQLVRDELALSLLPHRASSQRRPS